MWKEPGEGYQIASSYTFFCGRRNVNHHLGIGFFGHNFSYIIELFQQLKGQNLLVTGCSWCDITVSNVHAPTEDKVDDIKDRF
jgi:hypothetical protein